VDGDGYGDVSQDRCPQSKLTQDPCAPPGTFVTKAPPRSTTHRKVKIVFASETATSFTCSVDGAPAAPCASPYKKKLKLGKHAVLITGVSAFGISDPTPAKVTFRVRR
jgi:hypothetical protein